MALKKYFGTDGIRGRVGDHPITPEFILKLGWAVGRVLGTRGSGENKILVGKDTRVSGYMFESALEAGLSSAGVNVHLLGPLPTPAIAYLTRKLNARAGIVISASHNMFEDNGIKFFSHDGIKLSDEVELEIETELEGIQKVVEPHLLGKASRVLSASDDYIKFCKQTVIAKYSFSDLKVVVDCAHGAGYLVGPNLLSDLGCNVVSIGNEPNGFNINDGFGSTNPEALRRTVLMEGADIGIALDGDGDRVIMVDESGAVVDGDDIIFVIAHFRQKLGRLRGSVVGTTMSNLGLEEAILGLGLGFERSGVGDRCVLEKLRDGGWSLGGEPSCHIICYDLTTTGDGLVSSLQVLQAMVESGLSLSELRKPVKKIPQVLLNVEVSEEFSLAQFPKIHRELNRISSTLGTSGRVLLRESGTEPVVRIMVEGPDRQGITSLATDLARAVESTKS